MNQTHVKMAELVEQISDLLRNANGGSIPVCEWEETYKELRGIKAWFGNEKSWDTVEKEAGDQWIKDARSDKAFKEYYKLRAEYDKLEVLVK